MDEGADIVSVLREKNKDNEDSPFKDDTRTSDFSEIYLFFDYDFQNKNLTLDEMNVQLKVEKPCARDPRSPVPLTLAVQNSLTL